VGHAGVRGGLERRMSYWRSRRTAFGGDTPSGSHMRDTQRNLSSDEQITADYAALVFSSICFLAPLFITALGILVYEFLRFLFS
jgi:hypothetical protein